VIRRLPRLATPVAAALATAVLAVLFLVPAAPAATARVYWTQPTPVQQARFTVKPGGNVSFTLAAATTRKRGIVHIAATRSLPGGAYLRWADGVKKAHATFTWSPTAPGDYTITFKASLVGSSTAAPFRSYAIHVTGKAIPYPVRHVLTTTTVARWSPVLRKAVVRAQPRASARRVTTLGTITSDAGTQELVLVLNSVDLSPTKTWYRIRLPILPNNSTGWVPAGDLGDVYTVRTHLYVDTKRFRVTLKRSGKTIFTTKTVGVGKPIWPTPHGQFYVRSKWTHFNDPFYGPVAFGTSARSEKLTDWPGGGFVGIHGTNQPDILPGRVSHGCVRLPNDKILKLASLMPVGTPVTIR